MLFYASPVLYVVSAVPAAYQHVYMLNPLAVVLTQMRHAVIDDGAPTAVAAIGGWANLLIPALLVAGTFVLGLWAFIREAPNVAENL
jgi:ABC-type polysaccharide/polyol phosphate export permease